MSRIAFEVKTVKVPLADLLPTRIVPLSIRQSPKFKTILASVQEIGIIEPWQSSPTGKAVTVATDTYCSTGT